MKTATTTKIAPSTRTFDKVLFDRPVPIGQSVMPELKVGKSGIQGIVLVEGMLVVDSEDATYYIPWSRVACAW